MNPSPLAAAVSQAIHEPPPSIRRLDEAAERDLAAMQRHLPARNHTPVKNRGNAGNTGSMAPNKALHVPTTQSANGNTGNTPDPVQTHRDPVPHFELVAERTDDRMPGVYWVGVMKSKDGCTAQAAPAWICSPLRVTAMTRDAQNGEWGRLLVFPDRDGNEHRWTCPQSMHAGSGDELRAVLLREGLDITTHPGMRRMVGDYIQRQQPTVRARCVNRTGWHGDVFALPRETFGDSDATPVLFQAATIDGVTLGQGGTLAGWIDHVAAPCAGNSRLVLVVSMGFAAPCLGLIRAEGGGVHLRGKSSRGKTTAQEVAASMYGLPEQFKRTWRATDNGLEGLAAVHSDLLLILDELAQLDPRDAGKVAYMLANGQGKSRSHRDGSPRAVTTWRLLFLSSGEVGLSDLVTQSGGKLRAGQEVRVIDLTSDAGAGLGLFEHVPTDITAGEFSDRLKANAATHYGHALPAFLRALVADPNNARDTLRALRDSIAAQLTEQSESGQVRRVAARFALIGAAGELATAWRLTGWEVGEAERAARTCFKAWLYARGTTGDSEPAAMLDQVRAFLSANGEARFTRWDASEDGARTVNRAGFRRHGDDGPTYYVDPQCFRRDVCQGFDHTAVARVLDAAGALEHDRDGRMTKRTRLPDRRNVRVYAITPALWADKGGTL